MDVYVEVIVEVECRSGRENEILHESSNVGRYSTIEYK